MQVAKIHQHVADIRFNSGLEHRYLITFVGI
jgi:hypothetical protein